MSHLFTLYLFKSVLILALLISTSSRGVFADNTVDEDFSDSADVTLIEGADQSRVIVNGQLNMTIGGYNTSTDSELRRVILEFADSSLSSIAADLTINSTSGATDNRAAFADVSGIFYNVNEGDLDGLTGAVFAALGIGDRGEGLEAWLFIAQSDNADFSSASVIEVKEILAPGILEYGTPVAVKLDYDGNNTFTYTVNSEEASFSGPAFGQTGFTNRRIRSGIDLETEGGNINATTMSSDISVDDVFINNDPNVFEDFSGNSLDSQKWRDTTLYSSKVAGGKMEMVVTGDGDRVTNRVKSVEVTDYIQAKVALNGSSDIPEGTRGRIRLSGSLYNDTFNESAGDELDGSLGEVWGQLQLRKNEDGSLRISAWVSRSNDPDFEDETDLVNHTFTFDTLEADLDRDYVLSMQKDDDMLIFKVDEQSYEYQILTPHYPLSYANKRVEVRVENGPGTVRAAVDDLVLTAPIESDKEITDPEEESGSGGGGWLSHTILLMLTLVIGLRHWLIRRKFPIEISVKKANLLN